jgi:6-phosphogluconolactonase/Glucosamine-6-phosphate isomerase/deaminase
MKITIANTETAFDNLAAWRIIGQILNNSKSVIGLATGRTTLNMHLLISEIYEKNPFDIGQVTFFGVDEVINVPREYDGACYTMLKKQLINTLQVGEQNFIMPPTISDDPERECKSFQEKIEQRGRVNLQVLGLGENGHIGFNQPGTPFESETRIATMDKTLEERIRRETNSPADQMLAGLTLGIRTIMQSEKILLVAKGIAKAQIVKQVIEGPVTTDIPASVLQLHPDCEILLDKDAASLLGGV